MFFHGQVPQVELMRRSLQLALRRCLDVAVGVLMAMVPWSSGGKTGEQRKGKGWKIHREIMENHEKSIEK